MHQRIGILVAASLLGLSLASHVARAEQFVLVDESYTHSAQTTKDSHYYPVLPDNRPKDWTQPVDYAHGSVHIILDVATKPAGDTPTKYQACFEGSPSYGCTLQSPTYTQTGRVEWDSPFKDFWYESTVDWSKGVQRMPLILKDTNNNKPPGDPKYMPSDLHVQVILVSAGDKFVPAPAPAAGSGGAGAHAEAGSSAAAGGQHGAAAGHDAAGTGVAAAGRASSAAAGAHAVGGGSAGSVGAQAAVPSGAAGKAAAGAARPIATAGTTASSNVAGAAAGATALSHNAPAPSSSPPLESSSGCRTLGGGASGAWAFAALVIGSVLRRRRARSRI